MSRLTIEQLVRLRQHGYRASSLSESMIYLLKSARRAGPKAILRRSRYAPDNWAFGEYDEETQELPATIDRFCNCTVEALNRRGLAIFCEASMWWLPRDGTKVVPVAARFP